MMILLNLTLQCKVRAVCIQQYFSLSQSCPVLPCWCSCPYKPTTNLNTPCTIWYCVFAQSVTHTEHLPVMPQTITQADIRSRCWPGVNPLALPNITSRWPWGSPNVIYCHNAIALSLKLANPSPIDSVSVGKYPKAFRMMLERGHMHHTQAKYVQLTGLQPFTHSSIHFDPAHPPWAKIISPNMEAI